MTKSNHTSDVVAGYFALEREAFAIRAKALRERLRSVGDSSNIIRAERDRDTSPLTSPPALQPTTRK